MTTRSDGPGLSRRRLPDDHLPRRRVGCTKIEVTTLASAARRWAAFAPPSPRPRRWRSSDAGYEAGVRYFDTSPYYWLWPQRGCAWASRGVACRPRDSFVLSTKIGQHLHAMKPGEKPPADFATPACRASRLNSTTPTTASCARFEHSHLRLGLSRIGISPWCTTSISGRPRIAPCSRSASRR